MMASTHVTFGVLSTMAVGAVAGTPLHGDLPALVVGGTASLLPDIDHPGSALGRLCPALSARLERTVGHRTATHSLAASAGLAVALAPLWGAWPIGYASAIVGFLSHLLLDCATLTGVPLLYPRPRPWVFPRHPGLRFQTGSRAETALMVVLAGAALALLPVSQLGGVYRSARYLLATHSAAYGEYRDTSAQTVLAFSGRWHHNRQSVSGRAWLLEATREEFLIAWHGELLSCGEQGDIASEHLRVESTGQPVVLRQVETQDEPWAGVLRRIPANALVSGRLAASVPLATTGLPEAASSPRQHTAVSVADSTLTLHYASWAQLAALGLRRRPNTQAEAGLWADYLAARRQATLLHLRRQPLASWPEIEAAEAMRAALWGRYAATRDDTVRVSGTLQLRLLVGEP
jgi:inner membrane protein